MARSADPQLPVYVVDTHTLFWNLWEPEQLGPGADAILRLAEAGGAQILIPAIVIAELYYLTLKRGSAASPARVLQDLDRVPGYSFSPLGRRQLEQLARLDRIPEMHDRLIAADAVVHDAVLITKDAALGQSGLVPTVW